MRPETAVAEWHGVHPASVLVNLVPRLWGVARNLWPLLLAILYGGINSQGLADAVILVMFFAVGLGSSILHAATLRYRVVDGRLEIKSGLLSRQARVVPIERIQNVGMVRNIFQRLSGLVEVKIETASGREAEGQLSAISVRRAQELIAALQPGRAPSAEPDPETPLVTNSVVDLLWAGASDLRLGAVAVLFAAIFEVAPQYSTEVSAFTERLSGWVGLVGGLAILSGAWLTGMITAVGRGFGFRLVQTPRALVAERGLFTRHRAEVVTSKVQLLTWVEPVVLRLNGLGSMTVETAAAREAGSGTDRAEVVVPIVDEDQVRLVCAAALGEGGPDPTTAELLPAHPLALRRAMARATTRWLFWTGLAALFFGYLALIGLLLWPLALVAARLDVVRQGYLLTERVLVTRHGWLTRETAVLLRDKVQSVDVVQGPMLRWLGLAAPVVRVAGSRVVLPLLGLDDALRVQAELIAGPRRA